LASGAEKHCCHWEANIGEMQFVWQQGMTSLALSSDITTDDK